MVTVFSDILGTFSIQYIYFVFLQLMQNFSLYPIILTLTQAVNLHGWPSQLDIRIYKHWSSSSFLLHTSHYSTVKFVLNYFWRREIGTFTMKCSSILSHFHNRSYLCPLIAAHSYFKAQYLDCTLCVCLHDHGFGFLSIVVKASGTFYPLSAFSCGGAGTGSNPGSSSSSSSSTSSTSLGKVGGISRSSRGTSPSPPSPPQTRCGAIITVPNETSSEGRNRQHSGTGAWGSCSILFQSNDIQSSLLPVLGGAFLTTPTPQPVLLQ